MFFLSLIHQVPSFIKLDKLTKKFKANNNRAFTLKLAHIVLRIMKKLFHACLPSDPQVTLSVNFVLSRSYLYERAIQILVLCQNTQKSSSMLYLSLIYQVPNCIKLDMTTSKLKANQNQVFTLKLAQIALGTMIKTVSCIFVK